jgi:hypothetical protein
MKFALTMTRGLALVAFVGAIVTGVPTAASAAEASAAGTGSTATATTILMPMAKCPPEDCNKCTC